MHQRINDVDFDHPFRIGFGRVITDAAPGIYGPESVTYPEEGDNYQGVYVDCLDEEWWVFSKGYTGQGGYDNGVMHASEFIGGRLEADMLATPGVYVVTSVECGDSDEDSEPAGWIVLKRKTRNELRKDKEGV